MTTNDLLRALDFAPGDPLTPAEETRRETLLLAVLADREPARPTRVRAARISRGWLVASAGALTLAIIGTAVIAMHHGGAPATPVAAGPLTSVELAGWTKTPALVTSDPPAVQAAEKWCLRSMEGAPGASAASTITNLDQRGSVTSMIVNRAGYAMLCIAGPNSTGFWELDGDPSIPVASLDPTQVTIESAGGHGDGATGFNYVEGRAGTSVASISLSEGGRTFTAAVSDGRWTAWWPDAAATGELTGAIAVTAADGTKSTVSTASLQK